MSEDNQEEKLADNSKISEDSSKLRKVQKMFPKKKALIIAASVLFLLIIIFFIVNKQNQMNNLKNPPTDKQYYSLDENKSVQDKGIRIFLKSNITDEQGDEIAKEFIKYEGVAGYSLIPLSLQQQYEKYNNLYPKDLSVLTPRNNVIIDLYVTNGDFINDIINDLKNNPNVQAVSNISLN